MAKWERWTRERTAHLSKRWAEGASSGVIARELGGFEGYVCGGRHAVAVKASHMGLQRRPTTETLWDGKPKKLKRPVDYFDWTPERVMRLRKLWAEGLSGRRIGQRFGVSRSAIAGKTHRLRLSRRVSLNAPYNPATDKRPRFLEAA